MKSIYKTTIRSFSLLAMVSTLGFFTSTNQLFAQTSRGTEFWITFPANFDNGGVRQLYITAEVNSVVDVNIANPAFSTTINVAAGTLATVLLPLAVEVSGNGVAENKGIHITSDNPVTVHGMNQREVSTDAFLALPVDAIGTDYYVMAYTSLIFVQMTVLATEDNTAITIIPTASGGGFTAGIPGNIVLNKGQVFQLRAGSGDYTGSKVMSDKPVSVFGGNDCANVPVGTAFCDHLVQQITPISAWGQSFVTVPLALRTGGDIFRIMAQAESTNVNINGIAVATLNAGQFYETSLSSDSYNTITSDKPVLVGQFCKGSTADPGTIGDPFFTLIPPCDQFLNNYIVLAGTQNISTNFLNITSPTANTGTVKVNGSVVATTWTPIPGSTFSGTQVPVVNGIHTITSILPVGLLVYGYGDYNSYGYLGGQDFDPVEDEILTITPKTGSAAINTNNCWQALLLDNCGGPVSGVRVEFNITGPNSGSSGFAFTNASGIATFCYAGPNQGVDIIIANVGELSDTATFTWTDPIPIPLSDWSIYLGILLMLTVVIIRFRRMV